MSPEQARGEELDSRSDIFGLGIVLYELLTHQRLFKRDNDTNTLKAVVGAKIAPPSDVVAGVPKGLDAIVLRALARKREERYQTAGELQLELESFIAQERLAATVAHLSSFMHELYEEELEDERFASEPTQIHFDVFAKEGQREESAPSGGKKAKTGSGSGGRSHPSDPATDSKRKRKG
jgi:serine/threonine-protein kinase